MVWLIISVPIFIFTFSLSGLFKGLLPTVLRDAPFSGIYLCTYESLKRSPRFKEMNSALAPPIAGFTAGVLASYITQPFDVLKTRIQVDDSGKSAKFIFTDLIKVE